MMLRVQRERMSSAGGGFFPSPGAYHAEYGLTPERFTKLRSDAVVMHPGPMNRGLEICAEAADSEPICHRRTGCPTRVYPHGRPLPAPRIGRT